MILQVLSLAQHRPELPVHALAVVTHHVGNRFVVLAVQRDLVATRKETAHHNCLFGRKGAVVLLQFDEGITSVAA